MYHVIIVETTEYVDDCVCFSDIREELISKSFALACTFDQSRNIHDFNGGWYNAALWFAKFAELDKTLIRYGYYAYIRLNRTEREVR
jgi:hypothetical protein